MSDSLPQYGLTSVRVMLGTILGAHGLGNLFGMFGGPGLSTFRSQVAEHVAVLPDVVALLVALAQLVLGAMLLVGTFARAAGWLALLLVVLGIWFLGLYHRLLGPGGCELQLAMAAMALCVALAGPGRLAWNIQIKKSK